MSICGICSKQLDNPLDVLSDDCGGDCILCMAECYDPYCIEKVRKAVTENKPTLDTEYDRIRRVINPKHDDGPEYRSDSLRRLMPNYD